MKLCVIDASVAIKWFTGEAPDEDNIPQALQILEAGMSSGMTFVQPPHWVAEIAAVLARRMPELASDNIADLLLFDCVRTADSVHIFRRAIALSQTLGHHLFDTLYHAAALEENATLITADRRYYDKAKLSGHIMLLEDFNGGIV